MIELDGSERVVAGYYLGGSHYALTSLGNLWCKSAYGLDFKWTRA